MVQEINIIGQTECEYSSDAGMFYQMYWSEGENVSSVSRSRNHNILKHCFPEKIQDKYVIELGVGGEGGIISEIKKNNKVFGIDVSESAIKNCEKLGVKVVQLNLDNEPLPFCDRSIDIVFGLEVFEHFASPQFVLEEVRRVLKDDGILLLTTPNPRIHHWPRLFYPGLYEREAFREFLLINKFDIIEEANIGNNSYSRWPHTTSDGAWSWIWHCRKISSGEGNTLFKHGQYFWNQKSDAGVRKRPIEAIDMFRDAYKEDNELLEAKLMLTWALVYRLINGESKEFFKNVAFMSDCAKRSQSRVSLQALCYLLLTHLELKKHGKDLLRVDEFNKTLKEVDRRPEVGNLVGMIKQEMREVNCLLSDRQT